MDLDYPWSILGIAPTADDKAIRRAYAARLKVTRPDEDAAGFQMLVEARDFALDQSRYLLRHTDIDVSSPALDIEPVSSPRDNLFNIGREPSPPIKTLAPQAQISEAAGRQGKGVGYIDASELLQADAILEREREPDVEEFLQRVGKAPWRDLKTQWADVFDALERTSLTDYPGALWQILTRLTQDLSRDMGQVPDVSTWDIDPSTDGDRLLGRYRDILRDFESRFGFLKQDRVLFDYLDDASALEFINALTIAVGRARAERPLHLREINVEPINNSYVNAAWENDAKMAAYYHEARSKDQFPRAFSWLALLFPLPFALYYRLYGVAAFAGILTAANAVFQILRRQGYVIPLGSMPVIVYLITAFALAFNWRKIRLQALAARVRRLADRGLGSVQIDDRLRAWGKPNRTAMWVGVVMLLLLSTARAFFR